MANISSLSTLEGVVNKILLQYPENQRSVNQRKRLFEFTIDGLRQLRLLTTRDGMAVVKVTPDINNRFPYPTDCEEPIGIAIPRNGELWYLTKKNGIITTTTVSGIDEILDPDEGEGVDIPTQQYETVFSGGGVNYAGYFTQDDANREMIINSSDRSQLLFVYISSGISLSNATYVPYKYVPAVTAYVLWQDILADRTVSENTKFSYEKRYIDRCREIKNIEAPSFQEMADDWATGNRLIK
jgi:hypothetical protein